MDGMSAADYAAISNCNDNWGGNSWFWIVVLFLFGFGNNGWGNNANAGYLQQGFDNQNVMMRFDALAENQARNAYENQNLIYQGTAGINQALCQGFNSVDKGIMQNTYDITAAMNAGFNSVNQGLCGISHQIADGVCEIKTQLLQDKYDKLLNDYNLSTMANANSVQTQNILGAIGAWYAKPPYAPYCYGTTTGTVVG